MPNLPSQKTSPGTLVTKSKAPRPVQTARFVRFQSQLSKKHVDVGFSEENETIVGRIAMIGTVALGVNAMALGTINPVEQLEVLTGLSTKDIQYLVSAIAGISTLTAFSYKPVAIETTRNPGPLQDPRIGLFDPLGFIGVDQFGLNQTVETFHGRLAMILMVTSFLQVQ
jgi:hypothetical protein